MAIWNNIILLSLYKPKPDYTCSELSSSPGQAGEGRELHKKRAKQLRNWKHVKVVEAVVEDSSWEDNRRSDQRREER